MAVEKVVDLGPLTAYDFAVEGGYEGTEGEFEEALGGVGEAASYAQQAVEIAQAAASNANEKASLAQTAAGNANQKAELAETKAGLADTAATRANQAAASAENMAGIVAPVYSASSTYKVGEYVTYNGAMYRCITAIDTAEAWTAAHWQAVNVGSEVTDLKSAFNDLVYTNQNYVKTYPYTAERYWQHGVIGQSISATARAYDKIPIVAGKTYYYRALYAYFCNIQYADETTTAFSENTANALTGSFTAQQDGFVYITVHTNYLSTALFTDTREIYTYGIEDIFYTPKDLVIYGVTNVYRVELDGSGDFTKITDAVAEAVKYKNSIVYIGEGDFDLVSEYGSALDSAGATIGGMVLRHGIRLIGTPKTRLLFNYTGNNDNVKKYWSVFNANAEGFTLENINIVASNIRYCVHDELNGYNDPYFNAYINCSMELDNTQNAVFPSTQCIGGGLGLIGHVKIENCYFKSEPTSWGYDVLSYHNSAEPNAQSRIDMYGCYVDGNNARVRFTWHGESTLITPIYVHGNSFGKAVYINREVSSDSVNNINVIQWNNEIRNA